MTPDEKNDQGEVALVTGHELDAFLGKAFEEKPIWVGLWESIRDVFFPVKLPPLQLTSKPIPVPDRMAVKPNPWAIGISIDREYSDPSDRPVLRGQEDRRGGKAEPAGDQHRCGRLQRAQGR